MKRLSLLASLLVGFSAYAADPIIWPPSATISVSNLSVSVGSVGITNHPSAGVNVSVTNASLTVALGNTNVGATLLNTNIGATLLNTNVGATLLGTPTVIVSQNPLPVVVTNVAVPVVGITYVITNLFTNASAAGTANYVAWAITNTDAFRLSGGSAILHSLTLINGTNRDYNIWIFPKVITAPTVGAAWTPSMDDLQHVKRTSTTNTTWATAGTNYVMTLSGIGLPLKNRDASTSIHIIGTHVDTKAGYNTSGYINIGLLQD